MTPDLTEKLCLTKMIRIRHLDLKLPRNGNDILRLTATVCKYSKNATT